MTPRISRGAAALVIILLAAACSAQPASPTVPAPSSAPAASATPSPTAPEVDTAKTHTFANGLTVKIASVVETKLAPGFNTDDPNAKAGDPYLLVTFVWSNPTKSQLTVLPNIIATFGADARVAYNVYVGEEDNVQAIEAGKSLEYDFGLIVPPEERQQVRIQIADVEEPSRVVTFVGSLAR